MAINRNRPNVATLKSVLDRSKESSKFSPYPTKKEAPIKMEPTPVEDIPVEDMPMEDLPAQSPIPEQQPNFVVNEPAQAPTDTQVSVGGEEVAKPQITEADAKQAINSEENGGGGGKKKDEVKAELTSSNISSPVKSTLQVTTGVDSGTIAKTTRSPLVTDKNKQKAAIQRTADIVYAGKIKPKKPRNIFETDLALAIGAGELDIDPVDGTLKRPAIGIIDTGITEVGNFFSGIAEGVNYVSKSKEEQAKILESNYQKSLTELAQLNEHTTTKTVANIGASVVSTLGIGAGMTALGITEAGSFGAATPFVAPLITGGVYTLGTIWNDTRQKEIEAYNISRGNGADEKKAFQNVTQLRPGFYTTGVGENLIQGIVGARTGIAISALEKQASGSVLKYFGKTMLTRSPEIIFASTTTGGLEYLRSVQLKNVTGADIDVYGRVSDAFQQSLALNIGFGAIPSFYSAGKMYVNKQLKSATLNLMATQDKTWVNNELIGMKQKDLLTEEQHTSFLSDLDEFQKMKKAIPGISEDKAPAVVGLMLRKKNAEKRATQFKVNDPLRADSDVEIQELQKQIEKAMTGEDPFEAEINDITKQPLSKDENATTTTAQQQQEGEAAGSISQYKGAEGEQAPKANEADNSNSTIGGQAKEVIPSSFNNEQGQIAWNTVKKVIKDSESKGKTPDVIQKNARINLERSKAFEQADDVTRNKMIADMNGELFGEKAKSSPSVRKIFGVVPGEKITVDEKMALKRFLKGQQDAANGAVQWIKTARQDISNGLNELVGAGKIRTTQLQSILKRYDGLNLQNRVAVEKFTDYVSNVINDATYAENLDKANIIKSKIATLSKNKNLQINIAEAAKEFLGIKPGDVSDLGAYMAKANEVYEGISRPVKTKTGAKFAQAFDEKAVYDYVKNENNVIMEKTKANRMADYQELLDNNIVSENMTLDEIETIITEFENTGTTTVENADSKVKSIRLSAEDRFKSLAEIANNILDRGDDGFGNKVDVSISDNDRRILKDLIKVGIKNMSVEDAYRAVNGLDNFIVNGKHSGLEKPLYSYYGSKNAEYSGKILNSTPMTSGGRLAYDLSGTVQMLFRNLFGTKDNEIMKSMGFTDYYNSVTKSNLETKAIIKEFSNKFGKTKPNGLRFDDADNIFEMGLYSHLLRHSGGSEQDIANEFRRRVRIFEGSIANLKSSNKADHKFLAESYERARVKLLDGATTIDDVTARMDKTNVEAVNWWVEKWGGKYNEMSDLAKNYYNKTLNKDYNYTPDVFRKIKNKDIATNANEDTWDNGYIMNSTDYFPASESSTLKATVKPSEIGQDNFISLDFFKDMETKYRQSLYDLNGSKYISQMKSFINNPGYKNLFKGNPEDGDMLAKRVKGYANKTRGSYGTNFDMADWSGFAKGMTTFNKMATASTLAGFRQIGQQLVPMVNAFAQTGSLPVAEAMYNPHVISIMDNSQRDIAMTGFEGDVNFKPSEIYTQSAINDRNKFTKVLDNTASFMLRTFVQNPDKVARRVGWWAFYKDKLSKNGYDLEEIDWSTHKLDEEAADYAQQMINTTQNVVQTELKGMIGSSKNPTVNLLKSTIMPLSDFMINQKLNFWNNLNKSFSSTSSVQDRSAAFAGVAGILVEAAVFNSVKRGFGTITDWVSDAITGYTPSEKELDDREKRADMSTSSNIITDLSPLPPQLNSVSTGVSNFILQKYYDINKIPDELRMEIGNFKSKSVGAEAGLFGMGLGAVSTGMEMINAGITGDIDKTVKGHDKEYKLIKTDRNTATLWGSIATLQAAGIPLPSDVKQITSGVLNRLKQKSLDENDYREYLINKKLARLIKENKIPMKTIDGKNIVDNFAYSMTINDPLSRGSYLADMYKKFGKQEFNTLTYNLREGAETGNDIKRKEIISNKDYFMTMSILSKEQEQIDLAYALSFKAPEANAYKLFELRSKSQSPSQFYANLGIAMETGAVSRDALIKYAGYLHEKLPNPETDMMFLDKFFKASKMSKFIPESPKKD